MGNTIDLTNLVVPKVAKAVLSDSKITFIYGWRDGGKSTSAFIPLIYRCLIDKHFRFAHCRANYNELARSTFQTIKDCIKAMRLEKYFHITKDGFQIINKANPNNFFFGASADQPDKIRSTANLSGFIVDEAHDITELHFASLIGTMRENKELATPTKAIFLFNNDKVSKNSFLYQSFFDEKSPMYNEVERVMVSHLDNPFIDQVETERKLMMVALNDRNRYESLVRGEFIREYNKNPFFYAFDKQKHIAKAELSWNPQLPLYLSFDFNIDPMTCIVAQLVPCQFIAILKAYKIHNCTLKELTRRIKSDFPNAVYRVTADPAGGARSAGYDSVNTTMHSIIRRELNIGFNQMDKPMLNFTRKDAWTELRIFLNAILQNHPNFIICPTFAKDLIQDIELATTTEGEDKLYKTSGNTEYGMHLVDGFIYLLTTYLNNYVKRQL